MENKIMANSIQSVPGSKLDTSFYVGSPTPRLLNEEQGKKTIGVVNEVDENLVTKKDLRALTIVAFAAGICSIAVTGGLSAVLIGVALLVIGLWSLYKSTTVQTHIEDAQLYAWHATDFAGRKAPADRKELTIGQRIGAFFTNIPADRLKSLLDSQANGASAASAERTVRPRRVRTQAVG